MLGTGDFEWDKKSQKWDVKCHLELARVFCHRVPSLHELDATSRIAIGRGGRPSEDHEMTQDLTEPAGREERGRLRTVAELLAEARRPHAPLRKLDDVPREEDRRGADVVAIPMSLEGFNLTSASIRMSRPKLARIYDWRPLELIDRDRQLSTTHVVGVNASTERWCVTSRVFGVWGRLAVETRDGVRGLGTPGSGELTRAMLDLVERAVRDEGIANERLLAVDRYAPETRGRWWKEDESISRLTTRIPDKDDWSVDRLIRRNRNLIEVDLAADLEVLSLLGGGAGAPAVSVRDWWLIAIRDLGAGATTIHVVGANSLSSEHWVSHPLEWIALDLSSCRSAYGSHTLGRWASGPPTPDALVAIVVALREWGIDEEYGLDTVTPEEIVRDTG